MQGVIGKMLFAAMVLGFAATAHAQQTTLVKQQCQNEMPFSHSELTNNPPNGNSIKLDIPSSLTGKISFYADWTGYFNTTGQVGVFAPAGWRCGVEEPGRDAPIPFAMMIFSGDADLSFVSTSPRIDEMIYSDWPFGFAEQFYNLALPLFPQYFPGGEARWLHPVYVWMQKPTPDPDFESRWRAGPHDKIIHVSPNMVVVMTPAGMRGLATQADMFDPLPTDAYSIIGVGNFKDGTPQFVEMIRLRLPPMKDYPIGDLLQLNERQMEQDFAVRDVYLTTHKAEIAAYLSDFCSARASAAKLPACMQ